MKPPENKQYLLFGGTFVLANKLQFVADKLVDGLTTKQWFLLRNIMEMPKEPPSTINEIAQVMDSSRQNTAKMLEVLERDGFVAIESDETDHRRRSVRITELGRKSAIQTAEDAQGFLARLFQDIPPEEQAAAGTVLIKMVENLERMMEESR